MKKSQQSKNKRKGDPLEDAFEKHFPEILKKVGFEVCKIHKATSRTNDITDFDCVEFKYKYTEEKRIDGKTVKTPKEQKFIWAVECKGKEGKKKNKVKHNELSTKAIEIQKELPNIETWIILAPERKLDDKSYKNFSEKPDDFTFRFHIEIWDDSNLEFRKIFSVLEENVWKDFFPAIPYKKEQEIEVAKFIKDVAEKGKKKKEDYEAKLAGPIDKTQKIIIEGTIKRTSKIFPSIHDFVDALNNMLDNQFSIVKKIYYPKTWKLGFLYHEYNTDELAYSLYPIQKNENDTQIKKSDKNLQKIINDGKINFQAHIGNNPVQERPKEYAKEIIKAKISKIIEAKLLKHAGSEFLAKEFIFAFIDKFHVQMGLDQKDQYLISEIEKAFYNYLPLWLKISHDILLSKDRNNFKNRVAGGRIRYYDPDRICEIKEEERNEIKQKTEEALKKNTPAPQIPMGNEQIPFGLFVEFFNFLKQSQKDIRRPYKPKDFSRLKDNGSWVWSVFSKKDTDHNLKIFFDDLLGVYESVLQNNFPLLKNELSLFGEADTILISWNVKDNYKSFQDGPTYEMYYLESKTKNKKIYLLTEKEAETLKNLDFKTREITFRKKKYQIISRRSSVLDFIYEDTPMLNFIYKEFEDQIKKYFKE